MTGDHPWLRSLNGWHAPSGRRPWILLLSGILYFGVILCPFLLVLQGPNAGPASPDSGERILQLLGRSVAVGSGAATLASVLGWPFACLLVGRRSPLATLGRWLVALLLFLPPYLNTIGLTSFLDLVRGAGLTGNVFPQGLGWAIAVLGGAFAPLVALIAEEVLGGIDRSAGEASLLAMRPEQAWSRIWLRHCRGPFLGCWLVVFWLTVAEYGVPMHFQVPVLATELVSAFVGGASPASVLRIALPLSLIGWLAGGIGLYSLAGLLTGCPRKRTGPPVGLFDPASWPLPWRILLGAGASAFLTIVLVPVVGLVAGAAGTWTGTGLWFAWPAFRLSVLLAGGAALLAVLLAAPLGDYLAGKGSLPAIMVLSLPLCLPPVLLGFAHAVSWSRPGLVWAHSRGAGLLTAHLARILPLCLLLALVVRRGLGRPSGSEAGLVMGTPWLRLRQDLPVLAPIFLLGLLLSLRELDVTLLTVPPGGETLPLRLFNLLHYGAGTDVCRLALLLAVLVGSAMAVVRWAVARATTREG